MCVWGGGGDQIGTYTFSDACIFIGSTTALVHVLFKCDPQCLNILSTYKFCLIGFPVFKGNKVLTCYFGMFVMLDVTSDMGPSPCMQFATCNLFIGRRFLVSHYEILTE